MKLWRRILSFSGTTSWQTLPGLLVLLVGANAFSASVAAACGGDWRNIVPSACLGIVLGQQAICAANIAWGSGSPVAKVVLQCCAVWLSAPVGAAAVRTHPTRADLNEWLAALFICSMWLTISLIAARLAWRLARRLDSDFTLWRQKWSISRVFSITTIAAIWLGMALSLGPFATEYRHNPAHWGAMLAADGLWIPIACVACAPRPPLGAKIILFPFVFCPVAVVAVACLETGQHDGFLQLWFAGPHQSVPGLDVMLQSGFGARVIVGEVQVALVTAFFAVWHRSNEMKGRGKGDRSRY
jgi:hypothetical protein